MSDWTKVNTLLGVIHNAAGAGPKFVKWAQKANDELDKHWEETKPEEDPKPAQPEAVPTGDEVDPPPPNGDTVLGRRL